MERFFEDIRNYIPADAQFQKAYGRTFLIRMGQRFPDKVQAFVFHSRALSDLPGVGEALGYRVKEQEDQFGTFWLKVHYDQIILIKLISGSSF